MKTFHSRPICPSVHPTHLPIHLSEYEKGHGFNLLIAVSSLAVCSPVAVAQWVSAQGLCLMVLYYMPYSGPDLLIPCLPGSLYYDPSPILISSYEAVFLPVANEIIIFSCFIHIIPSVFLRLEQEFISDERGLLNKHAVHLRMTLSV